MSVQVGDIVEGKVEKIIDYGAFVKLKTGEKGLVHISEVSNKFVKKITEVIEINQEVKVKVLSVEDGKIALSIKQTEKRTENYQAKKQYVKNDYTKKNNNTSDSFEDILSKFLKDSEERQSEMKSSFEPKRNCYMRRA